MSRRSKGGRQPPAAAASASKAIKAPDDAATALPNAKKSLAWTALESAGLCCVALLTLLAYTRFLTPRELGIGAVALALVQFGGVVVENLFENALVQRRTASMAHFDSAFVGSVVVGGLLAALCWLAAPGIAGLMAEPVLAEVLRWMGLSLLFSGLSAALIGWQRRVLRFRPIALASLLGRAGGGAVGVGCAFAGYGVWSLVAQQLVTTAVAAACIWSLAEARPRPRLQRAAAWTLFRFGVYPVASELLRISSPRVFLILIGGLLGSQAAGYFSLALRVVDVLRDISAQAAFQILLPVFSRLQADRAATMATARYSVPIACAVLLPIFGGLAVTAHELVLIAFGSEWLPAAPIIAVMAVLTFHHVPMMFAGPMINAAGRPELTILGDSAQLSFVLIGLLLFGSGGTGAVLSIWAARLLLSTPIDIMMLKRATGLQLREISQEVGRVALSLLGMMLAVWVLRNSLDSLLPPLPLLAAMVAFGVPVYLGLMWVTCPQLLSRITQAALSFRRSPAEA